MERLLTCDDSKDSQKHRLDVQQFARDHTSEIVERRIFLMANEGITGCGYAHSFLKRQGSAIRIARAEKLNAHEQRTQTALESAKAVQLGLILRALSAHVTET